MKNERLTDGPFVSFKFIGSKIRITRNPLTVNYMEAPDAIQQVSTFDDISQINRDPRLSVTGIPYRLAIY